MKRVFVLLAALLLSVHGTIAYSEGYSILVIPAGAAGISSPAPLLGNANVEEILSDKLIKYLEETNTAYAPLLGILKLSIKNNSNFIPNAVNPLNNAKIISKSYGVSKVILVSSKLEVQDRASQKSFWNKMELPVIIQQESDLLLITSVTFLDTRSDDILWHNIFYKNINCIDNRINHYNTTNLKLNAVDIYYDKLAQNIINDLKETKETHAIMINNKRKTDTNPTKAKEIRLMNDFSAKKPLKINNKSEQNSSSGHVNTLKPIHKTNYSSNKSFAEKFKNAVQLKYDNIKQEIEKNKIKKATPALKQDSEKFPNAIPSKVIKDAGKTDTKKFKDKIKPKMTTDDKIQKPVPKSDKKLFDSNNSALTDFDTYPVNNYLKYNRRNNSRNYMLKFDSFINDM